MKVGKRTKAWSNWDYEKRGKRKRFVSCYFLCEILLKLPTGNLYGTALFK